jgi:tetratricopeptide (TPR) repeat protein
MIRISLFFSFLLSFFVLQAHEISFHTPDTTKDQNLNIQMTQARLKYQQENYQGALRIYRELYNQNPEHAMLNYRIGESMFQLNQFAEALPYLSFAANSVEKDMELLDYYLGRAYQLTHEFEKAKTHYEKFIKDKKEKLVKYYSVDTYLSQVNNAIRLIPNPVEAELVNLGENINSEYVDAVPSITADQSQMIFTTRRPLNDKSLRDPITGEFYDAVYISHKGDKGNWTKATPIPGDINTEWHDANTSISPDGNTIYLYKNIKGETQSGDIYYSEKKDGKWIKPMPLKENKPEKFFQKLKFGLKTLFGGEKTINSSYFETSACVTADNNTIYFISEREKKSQGEGDIWTAHRVGNGWSVPKNLGKEINSKKDEIGVYIHPDGNTLFFSSEGPNSMGGYDIFMVTRENGRWQTPINLGYPINSPYDEYHFVLAADSKTAYISSNRDGGLGEVDIYEIDMTTYFGLMDVEFAQPQLAIVKGSVVDSEQKPVSTTIDIKDAKTGKIITSIQSDESGKYFITLNAGGVYDFSIEHPGMKKLKTSIDLNEIKENNEIKTWHFILSKQ